MNLIEQLGGYEAAKAFLNATSFTIDELIMMQRSGLRTQHVEKALLEYRRQHNIFETGDPVVLSSLNGIGVFESYVNTSKDHCFLKYGEDSIFARLEYVKHAPPEQIKTSKRLEVNQ